MNKKLNLNVLQSKAKERTVKTQSIEYDLETLVKKVKNNVVKIDPDYQRRHRWTNHTSSKLIESLILVALPIGLSLILPSKWFFEQFIAKSVLLISLLLGYFLYISQFINTEEDFPYSYFRILPFVFLLILVLVFVLPYIKPLAKFLEWTADKLEVFLIISIPLSLITLIVVLFRNIF